MTGMLVLAQLTLRAKRGLTSAMVMEATRELSWTSLDIKRGAAGCCCPLGVTEVMDESRSSSPSLLKCCIQLLRPAIWRLCCWIHWGCWGLGRKTPGFSGRKRCCWLEETILPVSLTEPWGASWWWPRWILGSTANVKLGGRYPRGGGGGLLGRMTYTVPLLACWDNFFNVLGFNLIGMGGGGTSWYMSIRWTGAMITKGRPWHRADEE